MKYTLRFSANKRLRVNKTLYLHVIHSLFHVVLLAFTKRELFFKAHLEMSHYNLYKNRDVLKIFSFRFAKGTPQSVFKVTSLTLPQSYSSRCHT